MIEKGEITWKEFENYYVKSASHPPPPPKPKEPKEPDSCLASLSPFHPTLPELLRAAGFNTALQGKWHVSDVEGVEAFGYDRHLTTDVDQVIRTSKRIPLRQLLNIKEYPEKPQDVLTL